MSELINWAEETLAPTTQLAIKGEGEYRAVNTVNFAGPKQFVKNVLNII